MKHLTVEQRYTIWAMIQLELLTLPGQKVKHKKLTFVEYEKTKNTLRQGI
jgi:hypothetical protein